MNAYMFRADLWCEDCIAGIVDGNTSYELFSGRIDVSSGKIKYGSARDQESLEIGHRLEFRPWGPKKETRICRRVDNPPLPKPEGYDPHNEATWDSDDYPKGPYAKG